MKPLNLNSCVALLAVFAGGSAVGLAASPLGTVFTYQGRLTSGTNAAHGLYDFQFSAWDAVSGGAQQGATLSTNAVGVSNGLFVVRLDFGAIFDGNARWLAIAVKTNLSGTFSNLTPRQPLTAAPYALWTPVAGSVTNGAITTAALADNAVTSAKIANGTVALADLGQNGATNGQVIKWSAAANAWTAGQDAGSSAALLGYKENGAFASPPVASGNNAIAQGEHAQALGNNSVVGGGLDNLANHWFTTIGGGWSNSAGGLLFGRTTVGGGEMNKATGDWSTVGGGLLNTAGGPAWGRATVAGGWQNEATGDMATIAGGSQNSAVIGHAVIGGGQYNVVSNGAWSTVGGGYSNRVLGMTATVPGGAYNEAQEGSSFAAGRRAKARHPGAFVWADSSSDTDFQSSASFQFAMRAVGGAYLLTPDVRCWHPSDAVYGWGAALRFGDGDYAYLREEADDYLRIHARLGTRLTGGNVGIGTASPAAERLEVDSGNILVRGPDGFNAAGEQATLYLGDGNHYIRGQYSYGIKIGTWPVGDALVITEQGGGYVGIGTTTPAAKLHVVGTTRTGVLQITGGSDVAEPFEVAEGEASPPGAVLVIDDQNPGRLRLSREPYDKRVAGVVSGAGGLKPGLTLSQEGLTDQGAPVALSGRVYTLADAAHGSIRPGDQLTTSATPGHAMRVTDSQRAQGAILGKAMTALEQGKGLVLVLVTLQ